MFTCVKRVRLKAQPDQLFPDGCCIISDVCWLLDQTGTETTRCRKTHLHLQIRDWNYRIAAAGAFTVQQAWTEKCRLRVSAEKKKKKKRRDYAQITIKKGCFVCADDCWRGFSGCTDSGSPARVVLKGWKRVCRTNGMSSRQETDPHLQSKQEVAPVVYEHGKWGVLEGSWVCGWVRKKTPGRRSWDSGVMTAGKQGTRAGRGENAAGAKEVTSTLSESDKEAEL